MRAEHPRWLVTGALVLAVLVAIASAAGLWASSIYARETASWAAQGMGQDAIDLLVIVPVLLGCAVAIARSSRAAVIVLAGVLVYLVYSFVLYALAMHFNALFLVYCATLGVAFYSLIAAALHLQTQGAATWFAPTARRVRVTGWFLIAIAGLFALLWLASVIPALVTGTAPPELAEAGLITNPVHVLDLALALPALVLSGALLLRGRPAGVVLAPVMLAFDVAMTFAILGMNLAMWRRGIAAAAPVVIAMACVAVASAWLLVGYLRTLRPAPRTFTASRRGARRAAATMPAAS